MNLMKIKTINKLCVLTVMLVNPDTDFSLLTLTFGYLADLQVSLFICAIELHYSNVFKTHQLSTLLQRVWFFFIV